MPRKPAPTVNPVAILDSLQEQFLALGEFWMEVGACVELLPDGPVKDRLTKGLARLELTMFPKEQ